jgi:hypothetical protein
MPDGAGYDHPSSLTKKSQGIALAVAKIIRYSRERIQKEFGD